MTRRTELVVAAALVAVLGAMAASGLGWPDLGLGSSAAWTGDEVSLLRSLWIGGLPAPPPDATNRVADDERAAELGQRLFFDARMSGNGQVSCSTCHEPERRFTDGRQKGHGIGVSKRNTRSIVGAAYSPWLYWDGRRDSLWAQALTPIEDPNEHGGTRMQAARLVATDGDYRRRYEALFGPLPDLSDRARFPERAAPIAGSDAAAAWHSMARGDRDLVNRIYANIGKAIEAYERHLLPGPSRFDAYVEAVLDDDEATAQATLTASEQAGLRLFIGEANCVRCHNGPLLTNNEFANTGVLSFPGEVPDRGRAEGVYTVRDDPFNCLGAYSDDATHACPELRYARTDAAVLLGAFRTPSLRNLEGTAPYMHKGQIATLAEVLDHYNRAPNAMIGHDEAVPLGLSRRELRELEDFLGTLAAPLAADARWLRPPKESPGAH
jgi:cytochrome c peroxidase